jgi:toxin ParE1/3/4
MMSSSALTRDMAERRFPLRWSAEAEDDLFSIWRYAADEWSPAVADEHLRHIERVCELLCTHPDMGRVRDELHAGARSIPAKPHVLFYRVANDAVQIMRVLHERKDVDIVFH